MVQLPPVVALGGWLGATNMTQETLVLGGGSTGLEITSELAARGGDVTLVDEPTTVDRARNRRVSTHESTLEATPTLGHRNVGTVVVATGSDARNLLLAGAAPGAFRAERIVALLNDPRNRPAFDDAGIETLCVSATLSRELLQSLPTETVSRPSVEAQATKKRRLSG